MLFSAPFVISQPRPFLSVKLVSVRRLVFYLEYAKLSWSIRYHYAFAFISKSRTVISHNIDIRYSLTQASGSQPRSSSTVGHWRVTD
ncbi:hypothetical protein FLAG1_00706 [Fusarium langsethiae]|uniref:Uncharacterized protein n=1 Tax=Fusarium langsethiae TaxID=179993 RepID=A0A0M9F5A0_FUSLA|nr:hypothetical protein FLAG1_00706 [Fusarium langsethiae]